MMLDSLRALEPSVDEPNRTELRIFCEAAAHLNQ
jgi:hypothetical protein